MTEVKWAISKKLVILDELDIVHNNYENEEALNCFNPVEFAIGNDRHDSLMVSLRENKYGDENHQCVSMHIDLKDMKGILERALAWINAVETIEEQTKDMVNDIECYD